MNPNQEKLLDADTKKLIKAGFLNNDLTVTYSAREEIFFLLFEQFKTNLLERADDIMKKKEGNQ